MFSRTKENGNFGFETFFSTDYLSNKKRAEEYNINNKIEKIIEWFTVFGDKEIVKRKIDNNYPEIANDDEVIEKILKLEYKGWSNYSRKLIDGISVNYNNRNLTITFFPVHIVFLLSFFQVLTNLFHYDIHGRFGFVTKT